MSSWPPSGTSRSPLQSSTPSSSPGAADTRTAHRPAPNRVSWRVCVPTFESQGDPTLSGTTSSETSETMQTHHHLRARIAVAAVIGLAAVGGISAATAADDDQHYTGCLKNGTLSNVA